ncbi:agmatine deiminase [Sansalvadorimonas verongulae]|uniref:agmatine deiminase n=1 Tax=Sansalvadorimonas verongulae TaxID=2172824 RepID=UPI0012BD6A4D|nr:agmatine deiminase [Sansalvadorimonas verongulae]MTI14962.1 agmatine deiminase [Sansalvadorimonas verongulae]
MSATYSTLPQNDNFRMPGEHEAHAEMWMAWPERSDNWRYGGKPAQQAFVNVAKAIAEVTPVTMAVSAAQYKNARNMLPEKIRVVEMATNDSWMRDIGPSYVVNGEGERRGVDWEFNAWGGLVDGLYFPWDRDDQVAHKICETMRDGHYRAPIVLEGGSIHVDGEGTLYTTEECLLHPSRNPDLSKEEIENVLKDYLAIEKVIWIPQGLYNDETNGHVDNLMHVVKPGEVVLSWTEDNNDPQYEISQAAYKVLSETTDARGRQLTIHKIHIPGPLYIREDEADGIDVCDGMERTAGERLAGSYTNYLITNNRIILPLLDEKYDDEARALLTDIYKGYEVVGVDAREILLGGGNIHCITQQVPAV